MSGGVFLLLDENTRKHCLPVLLKTSPELKKAKIIQIASGEKNKTIESCNHIWAELTKSNADRNSLLINLGGGVICDIGGFCASVYKRGIKHINIPTTLLSMVDAAWGGKTGIDFQDIKNLIGTFKKPDVVFVEPKFLKTLPDRQILSGMAEVAKHALIADKKYWKLLKEENFTLKRSGEKIINKSIEIKTNITRKDPLEKSQRKILNFGHTIGHAIESYSNKYDKDPILHGEAIAAGMICEALLSSIVAGLPQKDLNEIIYWISAVFPPVKLNEEAIPEIMKFMTNDKKNKEGKINFTLLKRIGKAEIDYECDVKLIEKALKTY